MIMKSRILFTVLFLFFVGNASRALAQTLEEGLRNLSTQIASKMTEGNKQKVAVIEFSDLDGKVTELGKFLSEELVTRLFMTKKFNVVERQLLNKIVEEHKLNLTGLVDETTAKQLGKILGVDAVCSGTITDLVNSVKINARLISTETGSVFAVASVQILKDEVIKKLMEKVSVAPRGDKEPSTFQSGYVGGVFFKEDFSSVTEGMLPQGWVGGDKLMIRNDGRRKFLTDFEYQESHKILIGNVIFPNNFELKYTFQFGSGGSGTHVFLYVGSIKTIIDVFGWCVMNQSKSERYQEFQGKVVQVALRKEDSVFRLFLNGEERIVRRYSDFKVPVGFSMEITGMSNFKLLDIVGTTL